MNNKLGFLGILFRANSAKIGPDLEVNALKAKLVIVAKDITSNTGKAFLSRLKENNIPYIEEFSKSELGNAVGRDVVNYIGIFDSKAAKAYLRKGE